jgi:hypothetical protein
MSLESMFSKKNMNLLVGLITIIALAAMYNVKLALGLAVVFIILFRFSYMSVSRMSFII